MKYFIFVRFMKIIICLLFILLVQNNSSFSQVKDSFSLQLFAEVYASSIPNKPLTNSRPGFHYNYTKANNVGVNMAMAKIHYSTRRFRTNLALMAGDYAKANLAAEEKWARNICEANAGIKLSSQQEIWLDAGVLPSHVGCETAVGKDNAALTRSVLADNSPYYETGLRLSYQPNSKWNFALLALTGWQRITVPANQKSPALGTQITYTHSPKISFNQSTYAGQIFTGTTNVTRLYHNLYSIITLSKATALTLAWDIGVQANELNSGNNRIWNGVSGLFRYQFKSGKWSSAIRYERFIDNTNVLYSVPANPNSRFNLHHASVNLDWLPVKNLLLRAEANYQQGADPLFFKGNQLVRRQFSAFFILAYNFQYVK
jgi:hypothetical protein